MDMTGVSNGRRAKRFASNVHVSIVRADGQSMRARVIDRSTTGVALLAETEFELNELVTVYFSDEEGFRGQVVRYFSGGAAIKFEHTQPISIQERAANDALPHADAGANKRRHERLACEMATDILLEDWGSSLTGVLLNMSRSGCLISADRLPPVGAPVIVGKRRGTVCRHAERGFAVEFTTIAPEHNTTPQPDAADQYRQVEYA